MLLEVVSSVFKGVRRSGRRKARDYQQQACQECADDLNQPMAQAEAQHYESAFSRHNYQYTASTGTQKTTVQSSGILNNARGVIIRDPIMKDESINYITNNIDSGQPLFDRLSPYTTPEAAMDSQARYPPPLCHPGTRRGIGTKLETWLEDEDRQWKMVWLHGSAGVGKSAVAQTFAEYCADDERKRFGAAFFFSRLNHRNEPNRVIPTLAYQLAIQCHEYRNLLGHQLVNNPSILNATMRVQFRKFIVDPFSELQARGSPIVRCPYVVILDGLDECKGEEAQCEILELINEVIRRKDLPILWLVCSRPEPHLKYMFSKTDFSIHCDREELVIDDEARKEVDQYLRDGFTDIRAKFSYNPNGAWPSEEQFEELSQAASGLFIVASTALKYIGDWEYANPTARLSAFLSFIKKSYSVGVQNPLETLDLLYTRILLDVPPSVLPTTRQILSYQLYLPSLVDGFRYEWRGSAQALCNLLRLDQNNFYGALRKLHSVIDVPSPEAAFETPLRFYHASFGDYLRNPVRSGKFVLKEQKTYAEIAKTCLYWHGVDTTLYHTDDDRSDRHHARQHNHMPLPGLSWVDDRSLLNISVAVADFSEDHLWVACASIRDEHDQDLIDQINNFDFRYIEYPYSRLPKFVNWLKEKPDDFFDIVRTVPCCATDKLLVKYLELMTDCELVKPATFPVGLKGKALEEGSWEREYLLLGHGVKACIICSTKGYGHLRLDILNSDKQPSKAQIARYREWVKRKRRIA